MADLYGTIDDEDEEEKDEEPLPAPKDEEDSESEGSAVDVAPASLPGVAMPRAHESTVASPLDNALEAPPVAPPTPVLDKSGLVAAPNARYNAMLNEGSGVSQHHGLGGGILKALDIAGTIAAPGLMLGVPGTSLNHRLELKREQERENSDLKQNLTQAQTETEKSKPELAQAKLDLANQKEAEAETKDKNTREINLRKAGMKLDANGMAVPLQYDDLSDKEKATIDRTNAEKELADAKTEYERTKADPNSPQNKAALQRIKVSAQNAATAAGKLGLDKDKYMADYLGVDKDGKPLAGAQKDENGLPIGVRVAKGNEATADRLKRSDLARNVQTNTKEMREIVQRRGDLFGPLAGRITTVDQMIGSNDTDISKLGIEIHNTALASNGAHGVRSAEAVKETEDRLLNHFKNGQQAVLGAFDALDGSVQTFIDDAQRGKKPGASPNAPQTITTNSTDQPPGPANPGMKWQHKTGPDGKVQWRQTKQ